MDHFAVCDSARPRDIQPVENDHNGIKSRRVSSTVMPWHSANQHFAFRLTEAAKHTLRACKLLATKRHGHGHS
jgi:hypothetical protein